MRHSSSCKARALLTSPTAGVAAYEHSVDESEVSLMTNARWIRPEQVCRTTAVVVGEDLTLLSLLRQHCNWRGSMRLPRLAWYAAPVACCGGLTSPKAMHVSLPHKVQASTKMQPLLLIRPLGCARCCHRCCCYRCGGRPV